MLLTPDICLDKSSKLTDAQLKKIKKKKDL